MCEDVNVRQRTPLATHSPLVAVHTVVHTGVVHLQLEVVRTQQEQQRLGAGPSSEVVDDVVVVGAVSVVSLQRECITAIGIHFDLILQRIHIEIIVHSEVSPQVVK